MEKNVNIFRAIAIIAVILIHFNSHPSYHLNIYLDQICRFAVPLFVALSGFSLAKKYLSQSLNIVDFYLRRVTKLLPWYLVFALLFHFWIGAYPDQPLWKILLFGRADYHLYFVPMIFQFYLLFPLLFLLVKKFPLTVIFLSLIWQVFFYLLIGFQTENPTNANRFWTDQQQYFLFLSWFFYFLLGIYFALSPKVPRKIFPVLTTLGLLWSIGNCLQLSGAGINLIIATRFTRLPVLLYSTGVIGLAIFYGRNFSSGLLSYLGKISYVTYLSHTLVLRFFFDTLGFQKFLPEPLLAVIAICASFFTAAVFSKCYNFLHELRN